MNIIRKARINKNIDAEEMAACLKLPPCIYLYLEDTKQFTDIQYRIVCGVLGLNYDTHI